MFRLNKKDVKNLTIVNVAFGEKKLIIKAFDIRCWSNIFSLFKSLVEGDFIVKAGFVNDVCDGF